MHSDSAHGPVSFSIDGNRLAQYSNHKVVVSSWRHPSTGEMLVDWQCVTPNGSQDRHTPSSLKEPQATETALHLPLLGGSESTPPQFLKRSRPRTDVDGEGSGNLQKKKRRLRLYLITSRLSKPYATPPTHINSRGTMRVGVWARQRVLGRDLLRKVAVLNSIRIKRIAAKEAEEHRPEVVTQSSLYKNLTEAEIESLADCGRSHQSIRHLGFCTQQFIPPPPSPPGLSNYDAFDEEDDPLDEEADEMTGSDTIYSDFSVLDPASSDIEDYDSLRPFDDDGNERELVIGLGEDVMGLIIENEKQNEVEVAFSGP